MINKYEGYLNKINKKTSFYAEFYLRNYLKVGYMSLMIRDNSKAIV